MARVLKTDTIYNQLIAQRQRMLDKIEPIKAEIARLDAAIAAMTPVEHHNAHAATSTLGEKLTAGNLKKHG